MPLDEGIGNTNALCPLLTNPDINHIFEVIWKICINPSPLIFFSSSSGGEAYEAGTTPKCGQTLRGEWVT